MHVEEFLWPKTGAIHYHAKLGLSDKGQTINGLVVCNSWYSSVLEPTLKVWQYFDVNPSLKFKNFTFINKLYKGPNRNFGRVRRVNIMPYRVGIRSPSAARQPHQIFPPLITHHRAYTCK